MAMARFFLLTRSRAGSGVQISVFMKIFGNDTGGGEWENGAETNPDKREWANGDPGKLLASWCPRRYLAAKNQGECVAIFGLIYGK